MVCPIILVENQYFPITETRLSEGQIGIYDGNTTAISETRTFILNHTSCSYFFYQIISLNISADFRNYTLLSYQAGKPINSDSQNIRSLAIPARMAEPSMFPHNPLTVIQTAQSNNTSLYHPRWRSHRPHHSSNPPKALPKRANHSPRSPPPRRPSTNICLSVGGSELAERGD